MTDTQTKALKLLNDCGGDALVVVRNKNPWVEALCRAIEQRDAIQKEHDDYKQKVSDAVEKQAQTVWDIHCRCGTRHPIGFTTLEQFIIKPKPDPLVEVLTALDVNNAPEDVESFRAALNKLGFEIKEKSK